MGVPPLAYPTTRTHIPQDKNAPSEYLLKENGHFAFLDAGPGTGGRCAREAAGARPFGRYRFRRREDGREAAAGRPPAQAAQMHTPQARRVSWA